MIIYGEKRYFYPFYLVYLLFYQTKIPLCFADNKPSATMGMIYVGEGLD